MPNSGYIVYPLQRPAHSAVVTPQPFTPPGNHLTPEKRQNHGPLLRSPYSQAYPATRFSEVNQHSPFAHSPLRSPEPHGQRHTFLQPQLHSSQLQQQQQGYSHMETYALHPLPGYLGSSEMPTSHHYGNSDGSAVEFYHPSLNHALPSLPSSTSMVEAVEYQQQPHHHHHHYLQPPYVPSHHEHHHLQPGHDLELGEAHSRAGSPPEFGSPSGVGSGSERGGGVADPPYAQLIFKALISAPGHAMVLKEIYDWFQRHTDKPQRAPEGKQGWKNSIRHNLSMNAAFEKIDPGNIHEDGKKGYIWRLSDDAVRAGRVQSTTRFRKNPSAKRRMSTDVLRQRQGNGGRVVKHQQPQQTSHRSPTRRGGNRNAPAATAHLQDAILKHEFDNQSYYPGPAPSTGPYSEHLTMGGSDLVHEQNFTGFHYAEQPSGPQSLYTSFSSVDMPVQQQSFGPYEAAETPSSGVSTIAESMPPEVPHSGGRCSPDIKFETGEIDGVSEKAHHYAMFEEDDQAELDRQTHLLHSNKYGQKPALLNLATSAVALSAQAPGTPSPDAVSAMRRPGASAPQVRLEQADRDASGMLTPANNMSGFADWSQVDYSDPSHYWLAGQP